MLAILLVIAFLIIAALSSVAVVMQKKVKRMEADKKEQELLLQQQQQEQRDKWNKSIQVLAQGMLEDQVTETEAAIRIGVLLEYLNASEEVKEEYSAFFQLAEATAHIPILEKWKALPTKEKLKYDKEREDIESKFNDFVKDAANRIRGQAF